MGTRGGTGVGLVETVPANATFDAANSTGGVGPTGWSCADNAPAGTECRYDLGTVEVGDPAGTVDFAVTVNATVPAGTTELSNTAAIVDDGTNGVDPGPNTASDTTPITANPDLTVIKSDGGATAVPGGQITYTLTASNIGIENVKLTENATYSCVVITI